MRLRGAVLAVVCLGAIFCLWFVFVLSRRGQVVEAAALEGSKIGAHYVAGHARTLLSVVSMPAAGVLVAIILLIGLLRRSHRRAVWAVVAVVGANLSTQALKYWILWRPDYDITARMDNANTLPSGHTTMATSTAVALILLACRHLQVLSLGEQVATILGSPTRRASAVLILLGTVLVAVVTMAAGPIGFVALVAPHLARLLTGSPQSPLLVSGLTGSLLLVGADLLSQLVLESMPVSVVTNAVGGLYLMVALTVAARGRRSL